MALINGSSNPLNYASSIAVSGNDVYVAGHEEDVTHSTSIPKYWKNSDPVFLSDGIKSAIATSIVIVNE
jgi:hypothetical protein